MKLPIFVFLAISLARKSESFKITNLSENDIPELKYLNTSVDPCENFYEFSCGNFKTVHPRPSNKLSVDNFSLLEDELTILAQKILASEDQLEDPDSLKKARAAYSSCVDTKYADTLASPELSIIEQVQGFPLVQPSGHKEVKFSWNDLGELVANYGVPLIFNIQTQPNLADNSSYYIYLRNESLSNPVLLRPNFRKTEDEVINESLYEFVMKNRKIEQSTKDLMPFDVFLRNITLKLKFATNNFITEDEHIYNRIDEMAMFMRKLVFGGIFEEGVEIPNFPMVSSITIEFLQNWTETQYGKPMGINWLEYFQKVYGQSSAIITKDTEIVNQSNLSKKIYGILNLVQQTKPSTLKDFALMRIFLYMSPDSDASTRTAFETYYKAKGYLLYPREEYCTRKVIDAEGTASISYAVAYAYQRYHFNHNKISKAIDMTLDLNTTFYDLFQKLDWMDEASRKSAEKKLKNMITTIPYPDMVEDKVALDKFYENLKVCKWDNYGNSQRLRAFKQAYQLSPLGNTRNRELWDKSPFDVNAYYNNQNVKIIFPISILNPIFFNGNISVLDYARIGSIIGHEMTHAFDSTGSQYNENGVFSPGWSQETKNNFESKAECFKEQYSQYFVPEAGYYIQNKTLNENLADNGGLRVAYSALHRLEGREGIYRTKRFSQQQIFFIGHATMWCIDESLQYLNAMKDNAHTISRWRVNGALSNMPEFSVAFNCPVGSAMNPEKKCKLW